MIVCEHCGFIAQHALQPLGMWPHAETELIHSTSAHSKVANA
jgi:hypothetical protein